MFKIVLFYVTWREDKVLKMSGQGLYSIDKLDSEDYAVWSVKMKSILVHSDLWGVTSGNIVKREDANPQQQAEFDRKDEKALATITLSVKSSEINLIKNCEALKISWDKLKYVYKPIGPDSVY